MSILLSVAYLSVGAYVYIRVLRYFENKHKDGDPEGLDTLSSLALAVFWPAWVPLYLLKKLTKREDR